ncbi:MAG: hypothetical protein NC177_00445 [Ruminococcus flavefaciens]|nr:hypothetical protein [Ruminococcus flavefaciens]
MKKLLALLLACVSLTCFSCGQDTPADEISESTTETTTESATEQEEISEFVGKWQGVKIIEDDVEYTEFMDIPMYAYYQFELCEDGFIKFGETTSRLVTSEWKWHEISSTEIEVCDNYDDISVMTLDGEYLVFEQYGNVLYFEKVEEFTPYEEETTERTSHDYIEADPTAFIGQWEIKKLTVNGKKQYLMSEPFTDVCSLEIYDDGTAVILGVEVTGDENPVNCTWGMVSGNEMELTGDNGSIIPLTLDGDYLTFENKDIKISFMKTNESVADVTENDFVGKWQGMKIVTDGEECTEIIDMPVYAMYQFELCEDGSVKFGENISSLIENNITMGWHEISSTEIELYREEDIEYVEVFRLDGEYLVFEDSGDFLYLERVDEFMPYEYEEEDHEEKTNVVVNDLTPEMLIGKWQGMYTDASAMIYQFEFNEDGTVSFGEVLAEYHEGDGIYKWEISGNDVNIISADGEQEVFNYRYVESDEENPHRLTYNHDGDKRILEKVDEFDTTYQDLKALATTDY